MYPDIIISGAIPRDTSFDKEIVEKIRISNSDILFIGLGTPFQELWLSKFNNTIDIPVQIAVGSGIDFISGNIKRAPKIMQKLGFEWLFRLFIEPKRLWKRYILGIPIFIFQLLLFKLKLVFKVNKS
jgi:N-acetylglucosaminyldiphosphoundecaprenol N-acetyl-beta-D-mannosaminyltransferase